LLPLRTSITVELKIVAIGINSGAGGLQLRPPIGRRHCKESPAPCKGHQDFLLESDKAGIVGMMIQITAKSQNKFNICISSLL